ncbi:MAG: hypothetical protein J6B41_02940 [Alistipes sp.]|nr:hypothetical protein [Alistipes sp.]
MKKFLLAVAALGMLMTSCSNDDTVQGDNSASVKFVVSTPELKTRADIADVYGTGFTANDLEYAIFECDAEGNLKSTTPNISKEIAGAFAGNVLETTFSERLVNGKHYVILFWADAETDPYKVDWTTQSISIEDPTALKAQDENLDAFFAKVQFTVKNGMLEQTVELKRPFAQLNVGVSDTAAAATAGLEVEKTQVKVKAYTTLNLFDGTVSGQQELTYALADVPTDVTFTDPDSNVYDIISMNYLLVNEKELNDVTFTYTDKGDAQAIPERTFSLVPVQRNHRTFVVGDLLTTAVNVKVIILPGFDNDYIYPTSIALALTEGGLFKLQDNTILDKNYTLSKATTIDLNGYDLTYTGSDAIMIRVADGGSLTITGEGNVDAGESYIASANAGGIITVEGGNFTTTGPTLFQANGGKVYISGGYFEVNDAQYGTTYTLNHIDSKKNEGLIEVTGGQFVDYNPAASKSENPVMSFVPDGYAASITGTNADGESIYKVQKAVPMTGLTAAPAQVYQAATLSWDAVAGAKKYVVKYNGVQVGETDTTTITTAEGGVADAAVAKFTVEALDDNGGMVGVGETPETKVFTLLNRPEPAVYLANGQLIVENKELNPGEAKKSNFDLNAILLEAEVYFYKDGATTPTYTAVGSYQDTYPAANLPLSITEKKIKNNVAGSYNTWKWNGGAATATAPEFEPGTYTIKYKAGYYPVMNAQFDRNPTDRIIYGAESDVLATMIYREGEVENGFTVEDLGLKAVKAGYQGAKLTWGNVNGAASYKVFANGAEKATVNTNEADLNLTDARTYEFEVKAYDSNGNVIGTDKTEAMQVWTLVDVKEPTVTFDANAYKLSVSDALDFGGTIVKMEVEFYKDGATSPVLTAVYDKVNATYNIPNHINSKRFTKAFFNTLPAGDIQVNWVWNGYELAVPEFEGGSYTMKYKAYYYPIVDGYWADSNKQPTSNPAAYNRVMFPAVESVLQEPQMREGEVAGAITVAANNIPMELSAKASVDVVELAWTPVAGNTGFKISANGAEVATVANNVGTYTYNTNGTGDFNMTVEALGTTKSATASAKVEFTIANWEQPVINVNKVAEGYQVVASNLCNLNYAYAGGATVKFIKDGKVVYSLFNTTGDGTIVSWAGYGRWALNAMDNRKDWKWTVNGVQEANEVNTHAMEAGTYTVEWQWDYVVNKNGQWATHNGSFVPQANKEGATHVYFSGGAADVCWVSSGVPYRATKSGTTTITVQ